MGTEGLARHWYHEPPSAERQVLLEHVLYAAVNVSEEYGDAMWRAPFSSEREEPLRKFIGELRETMEPLV